VREAAGCRIVTSFRGYDLNSYRVEDAGCYDQVWRDTDVVHAVSEAIWQRAGERGCPPEQAHAVVTDAVDVDWFEPPAVRDEVVGTSARPLRLLTVGRLHWKKGHDYAIAATRALLDRGIEVEHRIVGEGEHAEPTRFAIDDLGLTGRVHLLGARRAEEVRELLAWADVLVHPSLTEAFGVAAIEAQAMGLPVVCSDAGGLPENVEDGVSGFVVPRRDAEAIAARLAELAADPALRRSMGRAARRRAETALSAEQQLDRFEALYHDLLSEPARPATGDTAAARAGGAEAAAERARAELEQLDARSESLRRRIWRRAVVDEVREFVSGTLPADANVLVVSRGDDEIVAFPRHRGGHFPQAEGGVYAGHHPADSGEAIAHLEQLRRAGARYLVVPATSGWWLEHYGELAGHLERDHRRIAEADDRYVAYELSS
jgi:hypothetical protein